MCGGGILIVEVNSHSNGINLEAEEDVNGCWIVTSHKPDSVGYPVYKQERVHRYMYKKHYGDIPKGMVVRHKCDNKMCCNPSHFELGTQQDNVNDFIFRQGGNYMLTKDQIDKILVDTRKTKEIAEEYGVSVDVVNRIRKGHQKILNGNQSSVLGKVKNKKLSVEDVIAIYNSKESVEKCAEIYRVSKYTIYDIRNGHTWNRVTKHKENKEEK